MIIKPKYIDIHSGGLYIKCNSKLEINDISMRWESLLAVRWCIMKLKIAIRFIFQTAIILILGYFFNLNKNAQFDFNWNGFNIWLILSWICQLSLCIRKQLYPAYHSLATQGLKQYGEDIKQFGVKQAAKNDWSIANPRAVQADRTVFFILRCMMTNMVLCSRLRWR